MRVCEAHRERAVVTLKNSKDDSEYDLCGECFEAFTLIASGEFFRVEDSHEDSAPPRRRGRPPRVA